MSNVQHVGPITRTGVAVVGGGLGGVAAALAAARSGARTTLIERNSYVGGVATAGMCCSVFNCFFTSRGESGSRGVPQDIVDRLADAMGYGAKWRKHKGHIIFDLELGKLVLQRMLEEAGVAVLFQTGVAEVVRDGERVTGLVLENKAGRRTLAADVVVDATGDADVAALAGARLHAPDVKKPHSLCFRLGGVDSDRFVGYFREHPEEYPAPMDVDWTLDEALAQYDDCGTFLFPHGGGMQMRAFARARADGALPPTFGCYTDTDACQMHGMRSTGMVHVVTGFVRFDGLDDAAIARALIDGRALAFRVGEVYRDYLPGFENSFVAGVADNLGVRSSRWLDNRFVFTRALSRPGVRQPDAVARLVAYHDETRYADARAWPAQVMDDDTFDLPLRALVPDGVDGLVMGSGRSVAVEDPFQLRVMVYTMSVGQAAGTAAAVAAADGVAVRQVDMAGLRTALGRLGESV